MDLPEEDKTALAKRKAIQSLMKDKSLTPAQRHQQMQKIMKGDFPMDDDDDDSSQSSAVDSYSGSEYSRSESGSSYTGSRESLSMAGTESEESDDDESISVGQNSSVRSYDSRGSSRSSSYSGSEYSGSQYSRSQYSNATEDDSLASAVSEASSARSRNSRRNKSAQQQTSSSDNRTSSASRNDSGRRSSTASAASNASQLSTASAVSTATAQQKDKQKALLEISRDKSLSAKERQAKMKEIMATNVQGTFSRSSNEISEHNDSWGGSQSMSKLPNSNNSTNTNRRPSRKKEGNQDSIRECAVDESLGVQAVRTSRRKLMGNLQEISELTQRINQNDRSLSKIELQQKNLTDEDVIPLLEALGKNKYVTSLDLKRNRIGIEGSSTLASAILDNSTLNTIDISGNNLGDEGLEDLSKVLPYNKSLHTLNVEDNKIGDEGVSALSEALAENTTLNTVNLSGNLIGDVGASDLFQVLGSKNDTISTLLLRFNAISDKGATELASALLDNETLQQVDLGSNKITNKGGQDLLKVVSVNDTLEELELGGNVGLDDDVLEDIQRAIEEEESDSGSESEGSGSEESSYNERASSKRSGGGKKMGAESESEESVADDESDVETVDEEEDGNDAPVEANGGEAMLTDMADEDNAALAKRKLIQSIMQDKSLSPQDRHKKIQDVMAGRVELPKAKAKKPRAKPQAPPPAAAAAGDAPVEANGGEAMLTDMADEDNAALAKRKLIQSIMQDKSLNPQDRHKKIQDVMARRVELPKVEAKKQNAKPKAPPAAAAPSKSQEEDDTPTTNGKASQDKDERRTSRRTKRHRGSLRKSRLEIQKIMSNKTLSSTEKNKQIKGIIDKRVAQASSEDEVADLRRSRAKIKRTLSDASLGNEEKGARIQGLIDGDDDSSSGYSEYSDESVSESESEVESEVGSVYSEEEESDEEVQAESAAVSNSGVEANGGEAMLTDMPDETNAALAKRKAIQSVMQDKSLGAQDRHKKIQDIMAGRIELPKVEAKKPPPAAAKPAAGRRRGQPKKEESESESESESEASESSQSVSEVEEEEDTPTAAAASNGGAEVETNGGEAMLTDMPDETNTALAKRKAIQSVMQDKSISPQDRNKKIQDIMAGRVKLPKVEPTKPSAVPDKKPASRKVSQVAESESSESEESGSSYDESESEEGGSSIENNDSNIEANGGEAMLTDMPDESDTQLAKRAAIQALMKDKSLSPQERTKKMQDIMAGKVKLPPPPTKAPPEKSKSATKAKDQKPKKKEKEVKGARKKDPPAARETGEERRPMKHVSIASAEGSKQAAKKPAVRATPPPNRNPDFMRQQSYDGGIRTAIACEWKQRMMTVHPRSHDNLLDTLLAHQYRLSLKTPPCQSFFRVVAVVFFSRVVDGMRRNERYHVVGTNDEPHSISGSICAERAAMMQLRFIPDLEAITKIVIVTDDVDAISPGMLCREFMASHNRIPFDAPIVLGRSVCRKCGLTVSGKACSDFSGCFNEEENETLREVNSQMFATCSKGHEESKNKGYDTPHDFVGTVTTLRDLFPYPSVYARLNANEALKFGHHYIEKSSSLSKNKSKEASVRAYLARGDKEFNDATTDGSYRQEGFDLTMLTDIIEGDEDGSSSGGKRDQGDSFTTTSNNQQQNEGSSFTSNGTSFTSNGTMNGRRVPGVKSSMTHSLKTTIDFMRQVREDRHELDSSGLSGLSDLPGTLDHLTARTLRISSRLKPSQRREKLIRLATEVTALECHQQRAHPIRYGAAVLFSDGVVGIASQKVALEYGCTLDAVGQLATMIDKKAIQIEEDAPACRPILLVQCDQFGIAHAPFAQGRAYLTERGYGDCKVLIHQHKKKKEGEEDAPQAPQDFDVSVGEGVNYVKADDSNVLLRLLEVKADDLAPSPPDMFGGAAITKNHSQGGLQIQF